jgi:hypothetical protein
VTTVARFRQCVYEASSGVRCPREGWHVRGVKGPHASYWCTAHATWYDKYISPDRHGFKEAVQASAVGKQASLFDEGTR